LTPNANPRDKNPKQWERIWFPTGPQGWQLEPGKKEYKEGNPAEYEGENGKRLEEAYRYVRETGRFNPDLPIPDCPPKMEWVEWAL
jgi:nucleoporin NUP42